MFTPLGCSRHALNGASGLGTRALWSSTSAINVYVLWNPSSAYLKMKGCLHIICWIINKSHVAKQIQGKHSFGVFADWISLIAVWSVLSALFMSEAFQNQAPVGWLPDLVNFCWVFSSRGSGLWETCTHFQSLNHGSDSQPPPSETRLGAALEEPDSAHKLIWFHPLSSRN